MLVADDVLPYRLLTGRGLVRASVVCLGIVALDISLLNMLPASISNILHVTWTCLLRL